ncbi:MAG: flagellar motor switch protein FliG [Oscillospiraceae bacterium]|jgi:flagellar motor switch protein FliG|nr:flagellar motor switch protein FliG [Oscillospiraceae bacterium]
MATATNTGLTAKEKAAILLITLGRDTSAKLYKYMTDEEISQMTLSITTTRRVEPEVRDAIVQEFYEMCLAQKFITEGGIDYAREILEQAIGVDKANELIQRLSSSLAVKPFDFIRKADSKQILNVIHNEHPQTIALVLSYMDSKQAAEVLSSLPPDRQSDIVRRIANMGATSPEYVKEAERILEHKITSMGVSDQIAVGGIDAIVAVINSLDRTSEKRILESLDLQDSELAEDIRRRMFVFEDIVKLQKNAIQRVLKDVSNTDLAVALKMSTDEVKGVIFSNVSSRMKEMLTDDMDVMGPVRVRDVEEAQQRIVGVIRKLEDAGEIIIARGEGEDLII